MYFPNQKQIKINRELVKKNAVRFFLCAYQDNLSEAMKHLTHTGFKVYLALMFNRNGYAVEFSPAYISQITGMCVDTARKGLKELEAKHYLIPTNETKTLYNFYEVPQAQEEAREIVNPFTGEVMCLTYQQAISIFGITGIKLWGESENE